MHYKRNKICQHHDGSYIDFPDWIKNEKATTNSKNSDNNCFQYTITVALNNENVKNHPERISKINPFIKKYNRKGINFPSHVKGWKKSE